MITGKKHLRHSLLAAALWALWSPASALSLSEIKLSSGLHQPFKASIALRNFDPVEADRISVQIADDHIQEQYDNNNYLPAPLIAVITTTSKGTFINLSSPLAIDEPFLKFAVQLDSPDGLILRQYEVLLDPPESVYAQHWRQAPSTPPPVAQALRHAPTAQKLIDANTAAGIELVPGTALDTLALIGALTKPVETSTNGVKQTAVAPIMRHALAAPNNAKAVTAPRAEALDAAPLTAALRTSAAAASNKVKKGYNSQTLSRAEFQAALQELAETDGVHPIGMHAQKITSALKDKKAPPRTAALRVKTVGISPVISAAEKPFRAATHSDSPHDLDNRVFASNRADVVARALMEYKERLRAGKKATLHPSELIKMSARGVKRVTTRKTAARQSATQ